MGLDIYIYTQRTIKYANSNSLTHWLHTVASLVFGKGGKCSGPLQEKHQRLVAGIGPGAALDSCSVIPVLSTVTQNREN